MQRLATGGWRQIQGSLVDAIAVLFGIYAQLARPFERERTESR